MLKPLQQSAIFPYLSLLVFFVPLLLFNSGQQSLMPHDEGYYAVQARWIWEKGDWITVQWWGELVYDRTIGIQWLIALCYGLFGINETSARLPSIITAILSILLTYNIGSILINRRIAWLGSAILAVTPLWLQYSRMVGQDSALVFLELLGIWALLKGEINRERKIYWGILAGSTFGLGFLIKGFMIFLPGVAILPYLVVSQRQYRHLTNLGFYLGLLLGSLPVIGWFWAIWRLYGSQPFQQLFGKLFYLGTSDTYNPGPLYYLWNIPANAFPWPLFCLLGYVLVIYKKIHTSNRHLLLLGYPLILFLILSLFRTRTPYYPLQLMPFMALFAAVGLDWFIEIFVNRHQRYRWLGGILSYSFAGLGKILILAAIAVNFSLFDIKLGAEASVYSYIAIFLGISWLFLGVFWFLGNTQRNLDIHKLSQKWLATWLIAPWLTFALAGIFGLLGNRSPDFRSSFEQKAIAEIVNAHPINFVLQDSVDGEEHKTWILLSFYTPKLGNKFTKVEDLPVSSYAWLSPKIPLEPNYQILGTIQEWRLVKRS